VRSDPTGERDGSHFYLWDPTSDVIILDFGLEAFATMSDIWSGIGVEISRSEGEWLYRAGGEVHGPVPLKSVVNKLLAGEIDLDTPVAREGGEFHPISRVAAFSQHIPQAKKMAAKRRAAKVRKVLALVGVVILLAAGGAGYFVWKKVQVAQARQAQLEKERLAEAERIKKEREKLGELKLVALVSLGTEEEVQIKERKPHRPRGKRGGKTKVAGGASGEASFVSTCQRSPREILATLGKYVAKLNVCVVEEKKRDPNLPGSLPIEFVVRPDGKVSDFRIDNRHYRTGTLNNCMLKVFRGVRYPTVGGSNCSMTLPLKIGS
jgi:hypothetical protein